MAKTHAFFAKVKKFSPKLKVSEIPVSMGARKSMKNKISLIYFYTSFRNYNFPRQFRSNGQISNRFSDVFYQIERYSQNLELPSYCSLHPFIAQRNMGGNKSKSCSKENLKVTFVFLFTCPGNCTSFWGAAAANPRQIRARARTTFIVVQFEE